MNNHIPQSINKLENLPNEILHDIFDLIEINDLIRAFYNLNNRFNSILFSSNTFLHILYPDDIDNNSINKKILSKFMINQRYFSRLKLSINQNLLENDFLRFFQIRSLTIDVPTPNNIRMIKPEIFPRLEYLHIGYTHVKTELNELHKYIFSNGFPFLRKCSFDNINEYQSWTGSPSIRSLAIWSNDPRLVLERILKAAMYLSSFHLFLQWPSNYSIFDDRIIHQHSCLKYFKLHLCGVWTLQKLDVVLSYTPTIKYLDLYSKYYDEYMVKFQWNFQELAYIFLSRLPNLSYFDCEFILQNRDTIDLEKICPLHSCFNRIQYEIYEENNSLIRIFTNK